MRSGAIRLRPRDVIGVGSDSCFANREDRRRDPQKSMETMRKGGFCNRCSRRGNGSDHGTVPQASGTCAACGGDPMNKSTLGKIILTAVVAVGGAGFLYNSMANAE